MNTKIVYVLVSSPDDIYLEQAYVSMCSVRRWMPGAHITLLTDGLTADTLTGIREREIRFADEIVTVSLDGQKWNAQQRSRQLKTSVRNRIDGDLLFIDCDTIVARPLDEIDENTSMIAAARDTHSALADNPYREGIILHGHRLGWAVEKEKDYFNSGIIYVKDVPLAHEFYSRWNENLNNGYPMRVFQDQPAFAKTNYEMGHVVEHLPDTWNCELRHGIRYLKDAYVVHYLCTSPTHNKNRQLFVLNEAETLMEVKRTGEISEQLLEVIEDPFKGLAETTCCMAGEDVFFTQSQSFFFLRKHFCRGKHSMPDKMLLMMEKTTKIPGKLQKMLGMKVSEK